MQLPLSSHDIWLDGRNVGRSGGTGVATYAQTLAANLTALGMPPAWVLDRTAPERDQLRDQAQGQKRDWRRSLGGSARAFLGRPPALRSFGSDALLCPDLYRIAHLHYRYRKRLLTLQPKNPPRLMHWTYPLPIRVEGALNVVTVHDLIPLTHPELTGIAPDRFKSLLTTLCATVDAVVTVSETVREEIIAQFGLSPDRVTTLYQAVAFSAQEKRDFAHASRLGAPGAFVFYGRVESRKNIARLLEAHALSGSTTPLMIIGPDGDDFPDCMPRSSTSRVIRIPWSERNALMRTLSEAKALLFPSLAEGFGLPIIEAMALGTPVLTSRGGVTEEVAGGAADLVDPYDVAEIAAALRKLDRLDATDLQKRKEAGYVRAACFSPTAYRERLENFYARILEKERRSRR